MSYYGTQKQPKQNSFQLTLVNPYDEWFMR